METLNWLLSWIKCSELTGEYWIDDSGIETFADGDIGDSNHERIALEAMIGDEDRCDRYVQGKLTRDDRREIGKDVLNFLANGGDPRGWAIEKWGWILVKENNFTLYELDNKKIEHIASFIHNNSFEEDEEDEDIYIYEAKTGASLDFTKSQFLSAAESGNPLARLKTRAGLDTTNTQNEQVQSNILTMELKATIGEPKYQQLMQQLYYSSPLPTYNDAQKLSVMRRIVDLFKVNPNAEISEAVSNVRI